MTELLSTINSNALLLLGDALGGILGGFWVLIVLIVGISATVAKKVKRENEEAVQRYNAQQQQQQSRHQAIRKTAVNQQQSKTGATQTQRRQPAAKSGLRTDGAGYTTLKSSLTMGESDEHYHIGAGEGVEEVQEIVGSLGEVNDEGCPELAHVRFLTAIPEQTDAEPDFDVEKVGLSMILGTAISEPKYKDF